MPSADLPTARTASAIVQGLSNSKGDGNIAGVAPGSF